MKLVLIEPSNSKEKIYDDCTLLGLLSIATYLKEAGNFSDTVLIDTSHEDPIKK